MLLTTLVRESLVKEHHWSTRSDIISIFQKAAVAWLSLPTFQIGCQIFPMILKAKLEAMSTFFKTTGKGPVIRYMVLGEHSGP